MDDRGIWESRRRPRRSLFSQVMLWVGLDRALRLDSALRMGKVRRAAVRRTRDTIKRQVLELGYDQELGAFTQALGHKDLDATALAVAMYEMLPPTDPRVVSTVKVLQDKLSNNGFLYRYVPQESEFRQHEGVFVICTLWLVNVLAQMGRRDEAEALFSRVTESANDLGLFAEEFDPQTGELLGNFPQALSHLSVINAALNLDGLALRGGKSVVRTPDDAPEMLGLGYNPRVAPSIDMQTQPPRILLVRSTTSIEFVDGVPDVYLEDSHKYVPRKEWDGFDAQVRGLYPRMARISISPEWAKLLDFETTLPQAVEQLQPRHKLVRFTNQARRFAASGST